MIIFQSLSILTAALLIYLTILGLCCLSWGLLVLLVQRDPAAMRGGRLDLQEVRERRARLDLRVQAEQQAERVQQARLDRREWRGRLDRKV